MLQGMGWWWVRAWALNVSSTEWLLPGWYWFWGGGNTYYPISPPDSFHYLLYTDLHRNCICLDLLFKVTTCKQTKLKLFLQAVKFKESIPPTFPPDWHSKILKWLNHWTRIIIVIKISCSSLNDYWYTGITDLLAEMLMSTKIMYFLKQLEGCLDECICV